MKSKQTTQTETSNIDVESLIKKAESIGLSEIPESTDQIVSAMLQGMKNSRKIVTAKMLFDSLKVKNSKFFSDKLWNLAKRGVVTKLPARGYYQYNFANETTSE